MTLQVFFENPPGRVPIGDYSTCARYCIASVVSQRLNIQRACEAALDMGQYIIRREKLGVPQSARDVFTLLAQAGWIELILADQMKRMVGFRNIAVQKWHLTVTPLQVSTF